MPVKRTLGFWIVSSLVIGNMIGSGIYLLPSALANLGTISILSWVASGIGALFLALVFARLGTNYPFTGGPYVYCREGFGKYIGFLVAYNYWIYLTVGVAAIGVAFAGYLSAFFPEIAKNQGLAIFASLILVWTTVLINSLGVSLAGKFQLVVTILKIIPLLVLTFVGFFFVSNLNAGSFNTSGLSPFSAISTGSLMTLWAFLGLESACIPADEVQNPQRTIPMATIVGTLFATFVYIAATYVIMNVIPIQDLQVSPAPFGELAVFLFGAPGKYLVSIGALLACVGTLNGWMLAQSRIALAAAKDGLFPEAFSRQSRFDTPVIGLSFTGLAVSLLLLANLNSTIVESFTKITRVATFAAIACYLYSTVADFILIKREEKKLNVKKIPSTIIAIIAFLYIFWAIASVDLDTVYLGTILSLLGVPLYAIIQATRKGDVPQKDI